jgi:hypothetical protein
MKEIYRNGVLSKNVKVEKNFFKRTGLRIGCNDMKAEESSDKESSTDGRSRKYV